MTLNFETIWMENGNVFLLTFSILNLKFACSEELFSQLPIWLSGLRAMMVIYATGRYGGDNRGTCHTKTLLSLTIPPPQSQCYHHHLFSCAYPRGISVVPYFKMVLPHFGIPKWGARFEMVLHHFGTPWPAPFWNITHNIYYVYLTNISYIWCSIFYYYTSSYQKLKCTPNCGFFSLHLISLLLFHNYNWNY